MTSELEAACARAFSFFCSVGEPSLDLLLRRIAWEFLSIAPDGLAELAIVWRDRQGALVMASGSETPVVPREIVQGLVAQHEDRAERISVRDHALDRMSFMAAAPRSSVTVRFPMDGLLSSSGQGFIWIGLRAVASSALVRNAESMSGFLGDWFGSYAAAIEAVLKKSSQAASLIERERELLSVLHDVRAPLAAIKCALLDRSGTLGRQSGSVAAIDPDLLADHIAYMEAVVSTVDPARKTAKDFKSFSCDPVAVARSTVDRNRLMAADVPGSLIVESDLYGVRARIPAVELERLLTNVIGH